MQSSDNDSSMMMSSSSSSAPSDMMVDTGNENIATAMATNLISIPALSSSAKTTVKQTLPESFLPPRPEIIQASVGKEETVPRPILRIYVPEEDAMDLCARYTEYLKGKKGKGKVSDANDDVQMTTMQEEEDSTTEMPALLSVEDAAAKEKKMKEKAKKEMEAEMEKKRPILVASIFPSEINTTASSQYELHASSLNRIGVAKANHDSFFRSVVSSGYRTRSWMTHDWIEATVLNFAVDAADKLFEGVDTLDKEGKRIIDKAEISKKLASIMAKSSVFSIKSDELHDSERIRKLLVQTGTIRDVCLGSGTDVDMDQGDGDDSMSTDDSNHSIIPRGTKNQKLSKLFNQGLQVGGYLRPMFNTEAEQLILLKLRKEEDETAKAFDASLIAEDEMLFRDNPQNAPAIPGDILAKGMIEGNQSKTKRKENESKWDDALAILVTQHPKEALRRAALAILASGVIGTNEQTGVVRPATNALRRARQLATTGVLLWHETPNEEVRLMNPRTKHWCRQELVLLQPDVCRMVFGTTLNTADRKKTKRDEDWVAYMQWTSPENLTPEEGGTHGRSLSTWDDIYGSNLTLEEYNAIPEEEIGLDINAKKKKIFYRTVSKDIVKLWKAGPLPFREDMLLQVIHQDVVSGEMLSTMRMGHDIILPVHGAMTLLRTNTTPKWMSAYAQIDFYKGVLTMTALRTYIDGMEEPKVPTAESLLEYGKKEIRADIQYGFAMIQGPRGMGNNTVAQNLPWCEGWFNAALYVKGNGLGGVIDMAMAGKHGRGHTWNWNMKQFSFLCDKMEAKAQLIYHEKAKKELKEEFKTERRRHAEAEAMKKKQAPPKVTKEDAKHTKLCITPNLIRERVDLLRGRVQQDTSITGRAESLMVLSVLNGLSKLLRGLLAAHCEGIKAIRKHYSKLIYCENGYWVRPLDYYVELCLACASHLRQELGAYESAALAVNARWLNIDLADRLCPPRKKRFTAACVKHVDQHTLDIVFGHRIRARRNQMKYLLPDTPQTSKLMLGPARLPHWDWKGDIQFNSMTPCYKSSSVNPHENPWLQANEKQWYKEPVAPMMDRPDSISYLDMMILDQFIDLGDYQHRKKLAHTVKNSEAQDAAECDDLAARMKKLSLDLAKQGKVNSAAFNRQYMPPPTRAERLNQIMKKTRNEERQLSLNLLNNQKKGKEAGKRQRNLDE